ncbi:TniQ family protein [Paenibacillus silvae]|nr:TniQ family protein [Paenibacillus silvae]
MIKDAILSYNSSHLIEKRGKYEMNIMPNIEKDESLISYVLRFIYANGYTNIRGFAQDWDASVSDIRNNIFNRKVLGAITAWTGISVSTLESHTHNKWGRVPKLINRNSVKYCPSCVKERGVYHQSLWNIEPVTICLEHNELLLDYCVRCKEKIAMDHFIMDVCPHCEGVFSYAKGPVISDPLSLQAQEWIQSLIRSEIAESDQLPILKGIRVKEYLTLANRLSHLLQGCHSVANHSYVLNAFKNTKKYRSNNESAYHLHTNVYHLLDAFPVNFKNTMERISDLSPKIRNIKIKACLQLQYDAGLKPVFKLLAPLLYIPSHCTHKPSNLRMVPNTLQKNSRKASKVACAANHYIILDQEVPAEGFIRRSEAANRLGVSDKVQLNEFINNKLLTLYQFKRSQYYINEREFELFLENVRGTYQADSQGRTLHEFLMQFRSYKLKLVELVEMILQGKIKPTCPVKNGKLSDVVFSHEELLSCRTLLIHRRRDQKGYTKEQVERLLKVDYATLLGLERLGILQPKEELFYTSGKRRISYYDPECIERIQERYLTIDQTCSLYGVSKTVIQKCFREGKLHDSFFGLTKKYIVDRQEIEHLLEMRDLC